MQLASGQVPGGCSDPLPAIWRQPQPGDGPGTQENLANLKLSNMTGVLIMDNNDAKLQSEMDDANLECRVCEEELRLTMYIVGPV